MVGSRIVIHSAHLCLLIGEFNPLTFHVITDEEGLSAVTVLFVFCKAYSFVVPYFPLSYLFMFHWFFFFNEMF